MDPKSNEYQLDELTTQLYKDLEFWRPTLRMQKPQASKLLSWKLSIGQREKKSGSAMKVCPKRFTALLPYSRRVEVGTWS